MNMGGKWKFVSRFSYLLKRLNIKRHVFEIIVGTVMVVLDFVW